MYSFSIDYLFNRVYDVLLWIKYVWLFVLLRKSPDDYLAAHTDRSFDGLRDRGWFAEYLADKNNPVPAADVHVSLWQRLLEAVGYKLPDSDHDGIPDVSDSTPYNPGTVSEAQLKERYEADYTTWDKVRDLFGIGPKDSDKDGVPDSYEIAHHMDPKNPDTDHDGIFDGQELVVGTDPLNNDTDGDLILDGRDAFPLDRSRSVADGDTDSDGDGIGDAAEKILGTDPHVRDTDHDGINDNMDTYPTDPENISRIQSVDLHNSVQGLHVSIQNPVLSFFTDLLSITAIAVLVFFVYVFIRWIISWNEQFDHFEHHFSHGHGHGDGHDNGHHEDLHVIVHEDPKPIEFPAGIPGLPVMEEVPSTPPTQEDFKEHPRFAIIKGYMSSQSEALWRIGILEADNMLAEVLRDKGYQGETVADMLKEASFKTVQMAWDAHGVRNRIAHEGSNFELTEREAKRAFTLYESVFRELKAIE